ncbi:MAG: peptide chain release factor N(5)-glutamine methyltransferase [Alphaproteobacteria bacterium]
MPAIHEALRAGAAQLRAAGVEQAVLDARLLLMAAAGMTAEAVIRNPDAELSSGQTAAYAEMISRRVAREPVSRILGRREFWSLDFEITPATLDPRPDSETLISAALDAVRDRERPLRILDIGTGSGCLLLALLSEFPCARGTGIDISNGALDVARRNAAHLGFSQRARFIQCDVQNGGWSSQAGGPFDMVVSNPPYIEDAALAGLAPEVIGFDPYQALAGGVDGLNFYRIITISLAQLLSPDGLVILETGAGQAGAVQIMLRQAGLAVLDTRHDLGGVARAVAGRLEARPAS